MKTILLILISICFFTTYNSNAQTIAKTNNGDEVILLEDGTWQYLNNYKARTEIDKRNLLLIKKLKEAKRKIEEKRKRKAREKAKRKAPKDKEKVWLAESRAAPSRHNFGNIRGKLSSIELISRGLISKPRITDNTQKTGIIRMKICVNKKGKVISADFVLKGSTSKDADLISISKKAVKKYKFKKDKLAPDKLCGWITFTFNLK